MAMSSSNDLQFGPSFMRRASRQASNTSKGPASSPSDAASIGSPGASTGLALGHFAPLASPHVNGSGQTGHPRPTFSSIAASDRHEPARTGRGQPSNGVAKLEYSRETLLGLYPDGAQLQIPKELEDADQALSVLISDQPVGPPMGLVDMTEVEKELFSGPFNSDRRGGRQHSHAAHGEVNGAADGRLPGARLGKRGSNDRFGGRDGGTGPAGAQSAPTGSARKRTEGEADVANAEGTARRGADAAAPVPTWSSAREKKMRDPNEGWGSKWKRASLEGGENIPRYSVLDRMREKANAEAAAAALREKPSEVAEEPEESLNAGVADMSLDRSDASKSFAGSASASPVSLRQEARLLPEASEATPPRSSAPVDEPVESVPWQYRDPSGTVQGPFTAYQMQEWYKASFFRDDLLVKRVADGAFETLETLILRTGSRDRPFLTRPPPAAPPNLGPPGPPHHFGHPPPHQLFFDRPIAEYAREPQDDRLAEHQRGPDPWAAHGPPSQPHPSHSQPWEHHPHHFGPPSPFGGPSPFGPSPHEAFRFPPQPHPEHQHLAFPGPRGPPPSAPATQHELFGMRTLPDGAFSGPYPSAHPAPASAPAHSQAFAPSPFLAADMRAPPEANEPLAQPAFEQVWGQIPQSAPAAEPEPVQQPQPVPVQADPATPRRDSFAARAVAPIGSKRSGGSTPVSISPKPVAVELPPAPPVAAAVPTPAPADAPPETPKKTERPATLPTPLPSNQGKPGAKAAATPARESPWAQIPSSLPTKPLSEQQQGTKSGQTTKQQEEAHRRNASIAKAQQQLIQAQAQERAAKEAAAAAKAAAAAAATPAPAPWSTSANDDKKSSTAGGGNGPSLAEIQALETKQAEKRKAAERQATQTRLAMEQKLAEDKAAREAKEALPSNATWGGGSAKPPSPVQAWKGSEGQAGPGAEGQKLSMKQIQEEEARRKKAAQAAQAAKAMPAKGGYAGSASPTPAGGPWSVVGGNKAKTVSPASQQANGRLPSAIPGLPAVPRAAVKPMTAAPVPTQPRAQVQPRLAPTPQPEVNASPEFMKWLRDALRGMNNVEDFVKMLLDFPPNPDDSVLEIISDSVYAGSATLDGRRFAKEFKDRRSQDLAQLNAAKGGQGGAAAAKAAAASGSVPGAGAGATGGGAFNVVQKKKRR